MIVFVDMDGVLCDYYGAHQKALKDNTVIKFPQSQYGFFINLEPIPRAIEYYKLLNEKFDLRILTSPSVYNPMSYTEKRAWVEKYLGLEAAGKMILAPDKSVVGGEDDYLIDDYDHHEQSKQHEFRGKLIHFGSEEFKDWVDVGNYFTYFNELN